MKRLVDLSVFAVIAVVSGAALVHDPAAAPETNADMARDAEPTQKRVKRADRKAKAPKKRRAAPATRPETNADIARAAQKQ